MPKGGKRFCHRRRIKKIRLGDELIRTSSNKSLLYIQCIFTMVKSLVYEVEIIEVLRYIILSWGLILIKFQENSCKTFRGRVSDLSILPE